LSERPKEIDRKKQEERSGKQEELEKLEMPK
jgi:hypothetical protein